MKTNSRTPAERELNTGTGMTLAVLGAGMLILCYLADGHLAALPALFGKTFLIMGILIVLISRHRPESRQKVR